MNCEQYEEYIMKHLDGEINDIENNRLMKHIDECDACARKLEDLKGVMDSLEQTDIIEPPCDLEQVVMEKIKMLDSYNKKLNEKRLLLSYFIVTMMFTVLLILAAVLFRENIFTFMLGIGIPETISYVVYGYLAGLGSFIIMVASCIAEFKDEITDFYYLLIGMLAITLFTKTYEINSMQKKSARAVMTSKNHKN